MNREKMGVIMLFILGIFSLACYLPLAGIAGPEAPIEALTQYADPVDIDTPTPAVVPSQTASPQVEITPTEEEPQGIIGQWSGTARWLCDDNPLWSLTLDFQSEHMATATLTGPGDPAVANAVVTLNGNGIQLKFDTALWVGTITGNTITGTFSEETCSGEWFVTREE